jgi:hypothetical protein
MMIILIFNCLVKIIIIIIIIIVVGCMYLYIESRIVVTLCTFWFYIKKILEINIRFVMVQKEDHSKVRKGSPSNHDIHYLKDLINGPYLGYNLWSPLVLFDLCFVIYLKLLLWKIWISNNFLW